MATILHAIAGYIFLTVVVRVLQRRAGSQMALFEFVIVFLMGGVIILATVGNDRSVTNCTCAVMAVGLLHRAVSWGKSVSPMFGALLDGTPLVVIRAGVRQDEVIRGMMLKERDLEAAARTQGLTSVDGIDYAILERNGRISVIKKEDEEE